MVRIIHLASMAAALAGLCSLTACAAPRRVGAVLPTASAPGDTIIVRTASVAFSEPAQARATVGGQPATVVRVVGPHEAEILVPETTPTATKVVVESGGRSESLPVEVTPHRYQRLVVTVESSRVKLETRQATSSAPVASQPSEGRLIAYEVVSPKGDVVFRGATENPLYGEREVFERESGRMHQTSPPKRGAVAVIVPIVPAGSVVRFLDVDATPTAKATARATGRRRVLGEFPIGGDVR